MFTKPMLAASGAASLLLCSLGGPALSQTPPAGNGVTALPEIDVIAPKQVAGKPKQRAKPRVVARRAVSPRTASSPSTASAVSPETAAQALAGQNEKFDEARRNLVAPTGAGSYQLNQQALEALPQGTNTPLDKVLLQTPGVSQDSAASGELHVRNEHANVQYRINGIMLPDGVGAFGQIIDTGIVGSLALITGALPAQYGLRTAGVLDIQTKADAFNNSGSVSVYGGSHGTITTSAEYGGTIGQTRPRREGGCLPASSTRFRTLPEQQSGIENPTPAYNAIHDNTSQEKGFLYLSTVLDPTSRLTFMSGVSNGSYQIPNNPGQTPSFTAFRDIQFRFLAAQRTAERIQPVQRARLPEVCRRVRLPALLFQSLQPVALLCRTRSAIWSSMAWLRMSTVRASSTASRKTPPTASASLTP